jgi:hypothetical protein
MIRWPTYWQVDIKGVVVTMFFLVIVIFQNPNFIQPFK